MDLILARGREGREDQTELTDELIRCSELLGSLSTPLFNLDRHPKGMNESFLVVLLIEDILKEQTV